MAFEGFVEVQALGPLVFGLLKGRRLLRVDLDPFFPPEALEERPAAAHQRLRVAPEGAGLLRLERLGGLEPRDM